MAKAKWNGPGVYQLPGKKDVLKPGQEFDSSEIPVARFNQLLEKGYIDGTKRKNT